MLQFFHRLRISQKLMLISILFMIPDSVLLCLFLISINDNIHFARWEKLGNQYQRPLEELLQTLPQHLLAASSPASYDPARSERIRKLEARIDGAVSRLEEVDGKIGADLQFTDEGLAKRNRAHFRAHILKAEWTKLKAALPRLNGAELTADHLHLLADVRAMITHAGDSSNLILDPDLDSYYLMDVTLLALPEMQDRLWNVAAFGSDLLKKPVRTAAERRQMAVNAALLRQSDLDRVLQSAHTALNEDGNFYGISPELQRRLPPALEEFRKAAAEFIEMTSKVSELDRPGLSSDQYLSAGFRAHAASFSLWGIASEELDRLLDLRMDHYRSRRARSLCLTALALSAAIGFVTFITRSISRPLQRQAADLQKVNAVLKNEIPERERAEAGLRTAEEKYRGIFENSIEGIFQTTLEGRYLVANPTLARMLGYDDVADLQAGMTDIGGRLYVDQGRRAEFQRQIGQSGLVRRFESEVVRKDGGRLWISENARAVNDADGQFLYYEGTVHDITERKLHEAALAKAQTELMEASRLAGMAEVATGVLHNIGNVLNSINVAAGFVSDTLQKSKVSNLSRAAGLLREHDGELAAFLAADPKGRQLPGYLVELSDHLIAENQALTEKMAVLRKNLEHVKEIVVMQQGYAKVSGVSESIDVSELVEDALRINASALTRHRIDVIRDYETRATILIDKHKAMQILVNLISNAKYACAGSGQKEKRVTVRISTKDSRVIIFVHDNGVGIPRENLVRIFNHGFTTRKEGHGFGLHSGAIAAKEMGGALRVDSDGPGRGATFILELPVRQTTSIYASRSDHGHPAHPDHRR